MPRFPLVLGTESGKAASAANATTHGLTSSRAVLRHEDLTAWEEFRRDMKASLTPVGEREQTAFD